MAVFSRRFRRLHSRSATGQPSVASREAAATGHTAATGPDGSDGAVESASWWVGRELVEEELELVTGGMPMASAFVSPLSLAEETHTSLGG